MRTPILCYHKVGEPHDRSLNLRVRDFRKQVAFLARRYRLIPLLELPRAEGRCVVLTFDDAYACSTEPLLQAARDYDATGTVFPVTALVGDKSRWDAEKARDLADWQALARLRDAGYEIGNHTHTHIDLSAQTNCRSPMGVVMDSAAAAEEVAAAERELEARLGVRPRTFAYPFGRYDDHAVRAVRARGYLAAVTVRYGIASDRHDPHLLPRIVLAYSDDLHGLLYKLYIRPILQGRR